MRARGKPLTRENPRLFARENALLALIEMERNSTYAAAAVGRHIGNTGGSVKAPSIVVSDGQNEYEGIYSDPGSRLESSDPGSRLESRDPGSQWESSDPGSRLESRDSALVRELVYGVTRRKLTLDNIIFHHSKIKKNNVSAVILTILRLGVYQLVFMDKIPVPAACDESVKLAKKYGNAGAVRFVNAILRKIAAEASAIKASASVAGSGDAGTASAAGSGDTGAASTLRSGDTGAASTGTAYAEIYAARAARRAYCGAGIQDNVRDSVREGIHDGAREGIHDGDAGAAYMAGSGDIVASGARIDAAEYLSVRHSYPYWLSERWVARYGQAFAASLMDAGNGKPEFTIRVNTLRESTASLSAKLNALGYTVIPGRYSSNALILSNPVNILNSPEFAQGLFSVQDESSMLCVEALAPQPGEKIMDVCAAPGGKCGYIAELTGGRADILAADIWPHRLRLMEQNIQRAGQTSIKTALMDATAFDVSLERSMDKVLLDAPCTGLGVIRRKPDIKWSKQPADIEAAADIQSAMIANASRYVKPGGALVYSVCTTEPEECELTVLNFLKAARDYEPEDLHGYLPDALWQGAARDYEPEDLREYMPDALWQGAARAAAGQAQGYGLHIYTNVHGIDGFYIARLRRVN